MTTPNTGAQRHGRTRGTGEVTANLIRDIALELFSDFGYESTTIRTIAQAVGVGPGSIYNHYASKEAILWDLVHTAMSDLERLAEEADAPNASATERLRRFVGCHVDFHARRSREARVVNRQIYSLSPESFATVTAARDRYERRLRGLIALGTETGEFAVPDVRIATYAVLQMGMAISTWYRPNGPFEIAQLRDHYVALALKVVAPD